jgi:acetoacetyl-CoA synthetase
MARPVPTILRYTRWLRERRGLDFDPTTVEGYDRLWRWSCDDLTAFWGSIWDHFGIQSPTPFTAVVDREVMPGAHWFEGAQVNYVQQVLRHADAAHAAGHPAIVFQNEAMAEHGDFLELGWPELRCKVGAVAARLRELGVEPGDRVCAFLPNTPSTAVAFLAVASLGAIWSICSPDMGPVAVLDRFRQIEPKVLIACDGYRYGGTDFDRLPVLAEMLGRLPSVRHVLLVRNLDPEADAAPLAAPTREVHDFAAATRHEATVEPVALPFEHPLWIVYSSGTTGLPKAIVHGHGGVVIEALKLTLHNDLAPSAERGDRFHWYSATGWIMWNCQMAGLLGGTTICLYDGSPAGRAGATDWSVLWRFVAATRTTFFGAGAAFFASCVKAEVEPAAFDLAALRGVGSTGSPLSNESYRWVWSKLPKVDGKDIWLAPMSGGTDFAGAFIAALPTLPVVEGEMQCRCLGASGRGLERARRQRPRPAADRRGRRARLHPADAVDAAPVLG